MKWPILMLIALLIAGNITAVVVAAPLAQGPKPVITQPEPDAVVRGIVQIVGSATHLVSNSRFTRSQYERFVDVLEESPDQRLETLYLPWPTFADPDDAEGTEAEESAPSRARDLIR